MIDQHLPESAFHNETPPAVATADDPFKVRAVSADAMRRVRSQHGRRTRGMDTPYGHTVRAIIPQKALTRMADIAIIPTLQATAQRIVHRDGGTRIQASDLRQKVRTARMPNLILFVVDASGSMAARQRMAAVKGTTLSLLLDAYQKRDSVGLIAFRGTGASLLLPPTNSVSLAHQQMAQLPTGGRTPLGAGLGLAYRILHQQMQRPNAPLPLLVLLSDGRANVGQGGQPMAEALEVAQQIEKRGWSCLVIDCESGYLRLGMPAKIGQALGGETIQLEKLSAGNLTKVVRQKLKGRN